MWITCLSSRGRQAGVPFLRFAEAFVLARFRCALGTAGDSGRFSSNGSAPAGALGPPSRLSHKAVYENLCGARCDGRGRRWERRGRVERAVAER